MNSRIEWIVRLGWDYNVESSVALYDYFDDFSAVFEDVTRETYKRYCREAWKIIEERVNLQNSETDEEDKGKIIHLKSAEETEDTRIYNVETNQFNSIPDLMTHYSMSDSEWECTRSKVSQWGNPLDPMYAISGTFKRIAVGDVSPEDYAMRFLDMIEGYEPKQHITLVRQKETSIATEICVFDHHMGQLSWDEETGDTSYDIKIARKMFDQCIDHFILKTADNTEEFILPLGNDFFNSDNPWNTTFAGTPQAEDTRWQKTQIYAEEMLIEQIDKLLQFAPVNIVIVPGNHDKTRIFYVGEFLRAWYRNNEYVDIDNSPRKQKYFVYGQNLIGYTHGESEGKRMPWLMMQDVPELYAMTDYHEWHLGHWHTRADKNTRLVKETDGIREVIIPSLVSLDDWHAGKGYRHIKQSVAMQWNKSGGKDAEFFYNPK